jgi:hypothetical protein
VVRQADVLAPPAARWLVVLHATQMMWGGEPVVTVVLFVVF